MIIQPGTAFAATAYLGPGRLTTGFPSYAREKGNSIYWMTFVHELGHNLGLSHAGGMTGGGTYQQYQDDALMGYQRNGRIADMNVIARYKLGWIPNAEVVSYPSTVLTTLRALNEGPDATDAAYLTYIIPCSFCASRADTAYTGGHLYLSLRVADETARYGVTNRIHVHPIHWAYRVSARPRGPRPCALPTHGRRQDGALADARVIGYVPGARRLVHLH